MIGVQTHRHVIRSFGVVAVDAFAFWGMGDERSVCDRS